MVMLIFHPNSPRLLSETSSSAIPSGPDSCSVAHLYSSANTFYTLPTTEDKSLNRRTSWLWRCVLQIQSEWGQGSEVVGSGHSTRVLIRKNMCWTVIWNNILHKFFSLLSCLLFVVVVAGGVWTVVYHIIIITTYSGTALMDPDGKSKESYLLSQKEINTRKNIYLPTRLRVMLGFYLFTIPWTAIWRKDTRRPGWTDLLLDNLFIGASMEIAAKSFALNFLSSDNDKLKQY